VVSAHPDDLRRDISALSMTAIRTWLPCSVCGAELGERCRDDSGTSAYLHDGRVRAAVD